MLLIFAIILILILIVLVRCIVIVPQSNAYVVNGWAYTRTPGARACTSVCRLWSAWPAGSLSRRRRRISSPSLSSPATMSP